MYGLLSEINSSDIYIHIWKSTAHLKLHGQVDNMDIDNVVIHVYPDADLCGTFDTTRATSDGFVELIGSNTFLPCGMVFKTSTSNFSFNHRSRACSC